MSNFKIGKIVVGAGCPAFIVAEIAQAHDGSLGAAHAYIDAVAKTGANAIKFQTHIASAESTPSEQFRIKCFPQDATRYDYWKRMELSLEQWQGLAQHAREKGLIFLSTPFSFEAVELLERIGMDAWKIASGETENVPYLERIASTGKPVLISTGMSSWESIDEAVSAVVGINPELAIFQCTTSYPCPPEKIGLNILAELADRYRCPVGLSDHSGTIFPSLAAVTLGASLIEVHTVFSRECFGPDVSSSVTTSELASLVEGIRFIESAMKTPVNKNSLAVEMGDLSKLFGRSLCASRNLSAGDSIAMQDICLKKPGTGIPPRRLKEFIGRRLKKHYVKDEQFQEDDFYGS